jgi:hypothetical protein
MFYINESIGIVMTPKFVEEFYELQGLFKTKVTNPL